MPPESSGILEGVLPEELEQVALGGLHIGLRPAPEISPPPEVHIKIRTSVMDLLSKENHE